MSELGFLKVHGAGNDFVLLDARTELVPDDLADLAVRLCHRRLGVGADGILVVREARSPGAAASMHIQNSDGSYAEMCGNGLRCVARYLLEARAGATEVVVDTGAGALRCRGERDGAGRVGRVRVEMGRPILAPADVPIAPAEPTTPAAGAARADVAEDLDKADALVRAPIVHPYGVRFAFTAVSMGNPHAVIFADQGEPAALARRYGPALEVHARFPRKANISFVRPQGPLQLRAAVWERGAGLTAACGTGAAAIGVAAVLEGREAPGEPIDVSLPGGTITVEVAPDLSRVDITGPAQVVYAGTVDLTTLPTAEACRQLTALLSPRAAGDQG